MVSLIFNLRTGQAEVGRSSFEVSVVKKMRPCLLFLKSEQVLGKQVGLLEFKVRLGWSEFQRPQSYRETVSWGKKRSYLSVVYL